MYIYDLVITDTFGNITNHYAQSTANPVGKDDCIVDPYNSSQLCEVKKIVHTVNGNNSSVIFATVADQ